MNGCLSNDSVFINSSKNSRKSVSLAHMCMNITGIYLHHDDLTGNVYWYIYPYDNLSIYLCAISLSKCAWYVYIVNVLLTCLT